LQLRNAKADQQLWTSLHNMYAGTAEDQKQPYANGKGGPAWRDRMAKVDSVFDYAANFSWFACVA